MSPLSTSDNNLPAKILFISPTLFSLLFAGSALYIGEIDPKVRQQWTTLKQKLIHWSKMYSLSLKVMPALALGGSAAAIYNYLQDKSNYWLYGGLSLFTIIPYTLIFMMPTNNTLNSTLEKTKGEEVQESQRVKTVEKMKRWISMHRVRSVLALTAAGLFFIAANVSSKK